MSNEKELAAFTKKVRESSTLERETCNKRGCEREAAWTAVIVFRNASGTHLRGVVARHLCTLHRSVCFKPEDVLSDGGAPISDALARGGMARPIERQLVWIEYSSVEARAFREACRDLAREGRTIPTILPSKIQKRGRST